MNKKESAVLQTAKEKAESAAEKARRIQQSMEAASSKYIRVGDDYLERGYEVDFHKRETPVWLKRKKETIIDDYGKECIGGISKYFSNCFVPSHTNYEQVIHNNFNLYHPITSVAKPGSIKTWDHLIRHIAGEQYDLLWDYVQILWEKPTQPLPVLCLVSKENNTGKSTFGNALSFLFEYNVRFYTQTDLNSQFNGWAQNLVAIFEEISDTSRATNIIKAVSTAHSITINRKFQQPFTFKPFIKVVVVSNNDTGFIKADENDQRYWVINVPVFDQKNFSSSFKDDLEAEVPAVIDFLNKRTLSVPESEGRMWFHFDRIKTDALARVIEGNRSELAQDIALVFDDKLSELKRDLYITSEIIKEWLGSYSVSYSKINAAMKVLGYEQKRGRFKDLAGMDKNQNHYHIPYVAPIEVDEDESEKPESPFYPPEEIVDNTLQFNNNDEDLEDYPF